MNTNSQDPQNPESAIRNLVAFRLGQQTYALPIEPIVQIIEMVAITPLPQANPAVAGVINVRGTAVPIISLRCQLGLPEANLQLHTPIILVQTDEQMVGLVVDQVADVLNVRADQIAQPKDILPDGLADMPLLQGLMHTSQGAVLLLDLEHLLVSNSTQIAQTAAALFAINDFSENDRPEPVEAAGVEIAGIETVVAEASVAEAASAEVTHMDEPQEVEA